MGGWCLKKVKLTLPDGILIDKIFQYFTQYIIYFKICRCYLLKFFTFDSSKGFLVGNLIEVL